MSGDLSAQLDTILRERDIAVRTVQAYGWEFGAALASLDTCHKHLFVEPFGAGMSSKAVDASNGVKNEIFTTLSNDVLEPASTALEAAQSAFNKIEI